MAQRIFSFLLLFSSLAVLTACAVQSAPEGGDKDVTPPSILKTVPENRSTGFRASRISIEFDEYVKVESFSTQFISSPPLKYKVEQSLRGKVLTLKIQDTLRPNTTYTFSFGNAIKDITENNAQTDFKYVFSTGAVLDSQIVSGKTIDAFSTNTQSGVLVGLYEANSEDSVFMKEPPMYYGLSQEDGSYSIENVAPGEYKLIAFKDKDFNYTWSGASEPLGFISGIINSEENPELTIPLFKTEADYKLYRGKYKGFGQIEMYFSKSVDAIGLTRIDTTDSESIVEYQEDGDTLIMWTNHIRTGEDGIWLVEYDGPFGIVTDTMTVKFMEKDSIKEKITWLNNPPFSISDQIIATSRTPISYLEPSRFHLMQYDSVPVPFSIKQTAPREVTLSAELNYGESLKWIIDSGAVNTIYNEANDSTSLAFKMYRDNELAIFHLSVNTETTDSKILELINDKNEILYKSSFTQGIQVDLFDILPQKIRARVIYDSNLNGNWTTGDYFQSRYPERVIYLDKSIELRANWEIDETWNIVEPSHTHGPTLQP